MAWPKQAHGHALGGKVGCAENLLAVKLERIVVKVCAPFCGCGQQACQNQLSWHFEQDECICLSAGCCLRIRPRLFAHLIFLSIGRRRHHELDTTTVHAGASRLATGGIPHDVGKPLTATPALGLRHQHRRGCHIGHDLRVVRFDNSHHGFR